MTSCAPTTPSGDGDGASSAGGCVGNCDAATPYEKKYATPEDAAAAALAHEQPHSIKTNSETTGWVKKNADGTYTPHSATRGDIDSATPTPKGADDVAGWHTHGAYDTRYDSEKFSKADKNFAKANGTPEYVGTPGGHVKKYDPADGSTKTMPHKIPADPKSPDK